MWVFRYAGNYIIIEGKTQENSSYFSFKSRKVFAMISAFGVKMTRLKSCSTAY